MNLTDVRRARIPRKKRFPKGKGESSGLGKTSGRGNKGQQSRSGYEQQPWFEGGQMRLVRRLPKRGFTNAPFRTRWAVVNVGDVAERFKDGETVDLPSLRARGLLRQVKDGVKVLGEGELAAKLAFKVQAVSAGAAEKIKAAGGTVEIVARLLSKPRGGAQALQPARAAQAQHPAGKTAGAPASPAGTPSEGSGAQGKPPAS